LLEADEDEILDACLSEKRVWVTFDLATVPDLLARFADEGRNHAGVFLADDKTVPPEKIEPLAAALADLIEEIGEANTTNLVRFIRRPK